MAVSMICQTGPPLLATFCGLDPVQGTILDKSLSPVLRNPSIITYWQGLHLSEAQFPHLERR